MIHRNHLQFVRYTFFSQILQPNFECELRALIVRACARCNHRARYGIAEASSGSIHTSHTYIHTTALLRSESTHTRHPPSGSSMHTYIHTKALAFVQRRSTGNLVAAHTTRAVKATLCVTYPGARALARNLPTCTQ